MPSPDPRFLPACRIPVVLIAWLASLFHIQAQVTIDGSFVHGGITRTYSFYVPASYVPGEDVPLVIGLHGLGSSGANFAQYRDFRPLADTANFIMVHPDGSTYLGVRFWNYGNLLGSTVDDVGFLEALIDTISAQYSVDPQRVYATGMSNGSFMCYLLACESDRFAAVGAVTGSMSVNMHAACAPTVPIPTLHIHGTEDGTNPYAGTSTMIGIEALTEFWVQQNGCDPTPVITQVPDTDPTDGATAEHYLYTDGTNGNTVELFKVIDGGHTWPGSIYPGSNGNTCMDFDARVEIWRFFSQHGGAPTTSLPEHTADALEIWPNPSTGLIQLRATEGPVNEVSILDLRGRVVLARTVVNDRPLDLRPLPAGTYLVRITTKSGEALRRLVIL